MRSVEIVERARAGQRVAVVSDAGTPGISDPGARLLQACLRHGIPTESLPGPCALVTALTGSGLPAASFFFGGFLPVKKGRRERSLAEALAREEATSVFYESPHRLDGTLDMLAALAPDRLVCVARELTKKFETYHRGSAAELAAHFHRHPPRGEIVLLIAPTGIARLPGSVHVSAAGTGGAFDVSGGGATAPAGGGGISPSRLARRSMWNFHTIGASYSSSPSLFQ